MKSIADLFKSQKSFNDLVYDSAELDEHRLQEITKTLSLCLHSEVSELVSGINYKDHIYGKQPVDTQRLLYESVDCFRYMLSILNLWEISPDQFLEAFEDKDLFLHFRRKLESRSWDGQPVVIVDLDDVAIKFREGFIAWLEKAHGVIADKDSTEYYTTAEVKAAGLNPEAVFEDFISQRKLRDLEPEIEMIRVVNKLRSLGCWIQLLTARPEENLLCCYDTYRWLQKNSLEFDSLAFSPEKYRWLTKSEYFGSGQILFAIDDSPKHSSEYAKHGVEVFVPSTPYNQEVKDMKNVRMVENPSEILDFFDDSFKV